MPDGELGGLQCLTCLSKGGPLSSYCGGILCCARWLGRGTGSTSCGTAVGSNPAGAIAGVARQVGLQHQTLNQRAVMQSVRHP